MELCCFELHSVVELFSSCSVACDVVNVLFKLYKTRVLTGNTDLFKDRSEAMSRQYTHWQLHNTELLNNLHHAFNILTQLQLLK